MTEPIIAASSRPRGVTARALFIGVALTPLNVLCLVRVIYAAGWATGGESLFHNTVAVLFLSVLANQWLKRRRPNWAFSAGELLTIYVMLAMGTGLTCAVWEVGGALAGAITYPFWFASSENGWANLL